MFLAIYLAKRNIRKKGVLEPYEQVDNVSASTCVSAWVAQSLLHYELEYIKSTGLQLNKASQI